MDQKLETEAREAAAKKAEEDKIAKAEADKKMAGEIAAAASAAAAAATEEAEKKAAEEAAKSKAEAEAAKSKAEAEAAAAASAAALAAAAATPPPPPPPPEEKKKPIKFKDAVGRKFSFPFHLCNTWEVCYYDVVNLTVYLLKTSDLLGYGRLNQAGISSRRNHWSACCRRSL